MSFRLCVCVGGFFFARCSVVWWWFLRIRMLRIVCGVRGMLCVRIVGILCGRFCLGVCPLMVCLFPCWGHLGGGDIRTTLSPRTMMSPSFFWFSTWVVSSVSSSTRFRCWSNPLSLPRRLFPPFRRTSTTLPRFCSRISVVISLML